MLPSCRSGTKGHSAVAEYEYEFAWAKFELVPPFGFALLPLLLVLLLESTLAMTLRRLRKLRQICAQNQHPSNTSTAVAEYEYRSR